MWSNGRSFLGHRLSIQLDDPFPFEKQSDDTGFGSGTGTGFGSGTGNRRSTGNRGGMGNSGGFGFDLEAANDMIPGLGCVFAIYLANFSATNVL